MSKGYLYNYSYSYSEFWSLAHNAEDDEDMRYWWWRLITSINAMRGS